MEEKEYIIPLLRDIKVGFKYEIGISCISNTLAIGYCKECTREICVNAYPWEERVIKDESEVNEVIRTTLKEREIKMWKEELGNKDNDFVLIRCEI